MTKLKEELKKSVCPLDCPDTCGLVAKVVDGKIISLMGDDEHPHTHGIICRKMKHYPERVYSEKRILHPLKRTGRKGFAEFTRISWEEAYAILREKIQTTVNEYGGEAILPFVYAGNMGAINRFAGYPLFNKLGASQLLETICSAAARAGWKAHCGEMTGTPPEKAENADLIVIWGSNSKVTNLHFWNIANRARKKGAKVVVVDPYKNITAKSADLHIMVDPAGDNALALGVMKIILEEGGFDIPAIDNTTSGFDKLKKYLEDTHLKLLSEKSGVAVDLMREFAQLLIHNQKTFIRIGIGMTRNSRAGLGVKSITSLAAALGLFDGGEGRGVLLTSSAFSGDSEQLTWPSLRKDKPRIFNMVQLGNAFNAQNPPIKLLFVYNANPLSVVPDGSMVRQVLLREDLFTVVHEQVMTPTAKYSDLILPATTFLENSDLHTAYGHFYMSVTDKVIEPQGEAKSNFTFFQELAGHLGFDDPPFQQSLGERMEAYFTSLEGVPEGIDLKDLAPGQAILSTRSKNSALTENGIKYSFVENCSRSENMLPALTDSSEFDSADLIHRYPLKLITPPHIDLLNSTFGERYEGEHGHVLINPADAAKYSVQDGVLVTLLNSRGWSRRFVKVTEDTKEGVVVAEGIYWQSSKHLSGINDLTSQKLTDMGGGGTFHESRVSIFVP